MFAKLLCIANWPKDSKSRPDYPLTFELYMEQAEDSPDWLNCRSAINLQTDASADPTALSLAEGQMLKRDIQRLANDLKAMINLGSDHLTFIPITPLFEIWVNRLSDDHYRIIVWQDMTNRFDGAADIGYQGIRFTSNRTRLMGFIRGLESASG